MCPCLYISIYQLVRLQMYVLTQKIVQYHKCYQILHLDISTFSVNLTMSFLCRGTTRFDREGKMSTLMDDQKFCTTALKFITPWIMPVMCHQSNGKHLPVSRTFSGRRLRWINANPSPGQPLDKAIHRTRGWCHIIFFQWNGNALV